MPPLDVRLSPNFSEGRQGNSVRRITFHHTAATAFSAVQKFLNPNSGTSAHFVVAPDKIYCCVDTDNTAWTNGNWASNLESVTIEHHGDWRNGYYDQGVIDQSAILVAWLRSLYPNATPNRHRDVVGTLCPADLPVELIWNKASEILNPPVPEPPLPPPAAKLTITDVVNRTVVLDKDPTTLWDLSFTTWGEAKAVKTLPKGTPIEVSAKADHPLGGSYYLTEYSFSKGINNGFNVKDCVEVVIPEPPVEPPVEPPIEPEPPVEPPVPPEPPKPPQTLLDLIRNLIRWLVDLIKRRK